MEYYNINSDPTKEWLATNFNVVESGTYYDQANSYVLAEPLDVSQSNIEYTNYYQYNNLVDRQNYNNNNNILSYPNQIINPAVSNYKHDDVQPQLFSYDQTFGSFLQQQQQQSPQQQHQVAEQSPISNSTEEDFFDIDDIINSVELAEEDLHQVLSTAGLSDFLFDDNISLTSTTFSGVISSDTSSYASSSVTSSPKRKYSTESLTGSFTSYDSSTISSPASSECTNTSGKPKRFRRSKHTKEERVVRKKDQNKKAAIKYRHKKKDEKQSHEQILEELEATKNQLTAQMDKLRTEFNVILPLAKASFTFDANRSQQLAQLIQRLNGNNLL